MPLFVVGFLTAIGLTSTNLRPPEVLVVAKHVQEVLLVAALVGLGTGIHLTTLRRTGGRGPGPSARLLDTRHWRRLRRRAPAATLSPRDGASSALRPT